VDFLAVSAEAGLSRARSIKTASVLQKRHRDQALPTGRQVRRRFEETNRAYGQLSRCVDLKPELAPIDSAVYVITDIVLFVNFTCALQSRPISTLRRIKISGDQDKESLKFSMQLLFNDSYVLRHDSKEDVAEDEDPGAYCPRSALFRAHCNWNVFVVLPEL